MRSLKAFSTLATSAVSAFLLASCGAPTFSPLHGWGLSEAPFVGHVHGLGVDPGDGTLYVAAHGGVFRLADGALQLLADHTQDTMGFTVVGPGHFLASGHPSPSDLDQPIQLGLVESRDAGKTWTAKFMSGRADFHSIDVGLNAIYVYDSRTSTVLRTTDQQTWVPRMVSGVYDLAANPRRPDQVLAATSSGVVRLGRMDQASLTAPADLAVLDWPADKVLVGATFGGAVHRSADGGKTWSLTGQLPGHVEAFTAESNGWFAATERGIFTSNDQGRQWIQLV